MGDKPAEKSIVAADMKGPFLEAVPPHMFMDPQRGTHGFEFGLRWNYENPKGDDPPPQQPLQQHHGGCCGGHQQQRHHHHGGCCGGHHPHHHHSGFGGGYQHHHHHGGFGGPRIMLPRPPPRQLGPFNPHIMMAGQGWHHQPPARFMAAPPAAMHMHHRYGGWGPHHHQHAANYNFYGGYEYEYDYPAWGGF